MAEMIYPGALVRVTCLVKDAAGALIDPGTLTCKVANPHGQVTTYLYGTDAALVRDSLGTFHIDVDVPIAGAYPYRFFSTGTGQASQEGEIVVTKSAF